MTDESTLTAPQGIGHFRGGRCGGGWALLWSDRGAWAWAPSQGWIALPEAPADIDAGAVVRSGVAVRAGRHVGYWAFGEPAWRSWSAIAPRAAQGRVNVLRDRIVAHAMIAPTNKLWVYGLEPEGTRLLGTIADDAPGNLVCAWEDGGTDRMLLLFERGLYAVAPPYRQLEALRPSPEGFDPHFYRAEAIAPRSADGSLAAVEKVLLEGMGDGLTVLDVKTWTISMEPLPSLDLHATLGPAYLAGDRAFVREVLVLMARLPPFAGPVYDVLSVGDRPAALACSSGVLAATADSLGAPDLSVVDAQLAPWRLWALGPEDLPNAFECVCGPLSDEAVARAILRFGSERGCEELVRWARGRHMTIGPRPEGLVALFAESPPALAAPLVRKGLVDADPSVASVACVGARAAGLWPTEADVPREELLHALGSPDPGVRALAAETIGVLRLSGLEGDLACLLRDPSESARRSAVDALAHLAVVGPETRRAVEEAALTDRDDDVRQGAVKALGPLWGGPSTLETLVRALADVEYAVRSEVAAVLRSHVEDVTPEQFWRLADLVLLHLMVAPRVEDPTDFNRHADVLAVFAERFEEESGPGDAMDVGLSGVASSLAEAFVWVMALMTALPRELFEDRANLDADAAETLLRLVEAATAALGRQDLPTRAEWQALVRPAPQPVAVAEIAARLAESGTPLARRLALVACYSAAEASPHRAEAVSSVRTLPLHARLRAVGGGRSPLAAAEALVRAHAAEAGTDGVAALYCLAVRGSEDALRELQRRVVEWEAGEWPVTALAALTLGTPSERALLASRLIASSRVPLSLRRQVEDGWNAEKGGELERDARAKLARDLIADPGTSLEERAQAAQDLLTLGESPGELERLWLDARTAGLVPPQLEFACAVALARCGHADELPKVRGAWIRRGALAATEAFAAVGTLDDIPELESAVSQHGAPEGPVRAAIAAIRARCAPGGTAGQDSAGVGGR
jgi:HEAT repeat protein